MIFAVARMARGDKLRRTKDFLFMLCRALRLLFSGSFARIARSTWKIIHAGVAELADAHDSKL